MANPLVLPALIGAGSSLLGGLFGIGSQAKANRTNVLINEQNNNLQRELANQKYAKDLEQWHRENAYNSPLAQSQRLLEAGLNPALQNVSTGQAQSSPEMALANTQPTQVAPLTDGSFMANAGQAVFSSMSAMEDVRGKNIDNRTKATENLLRLQSLKSEIKGSKLRNYFQELQNDAFGVLNDLEVSSRKQNLEMQKYQIERQIADNALLNKQLSVFDRNQQIYIQKSIAEIALLASQRGLNKAQISNLVFNNEFIMEQIRGLKLDNAIKSETFDYVVSSAYHASVQSYWNSIPSLDKISDRDFWREEDKIPEEYHSFWHNLRKGANYLGNLAGGLLPSLRFKIK